MFTIKLINYYTMKRLIYYALIPIVVILLTMCSSDDPPFIAPEVEIKGITYLTSTSAECEWELIKSGSSDVTACGICWNTTGNPSLDNYERKTTDNVEIGVLKSTLSSLALEETYFVVAYATNERGTGYGDILSYDHAYECGLSIEYSGKIYETVEIDNQCWFKENLNIGTRIEGSDYPSNNTTIEKYCYNNYETNCGIYGGLYKWDEMMQYVTTEGTQGICPGGWHVPTSNEWQLLVNNLGGIYNAGKKLKMTGTQYWQAPNSATNESGFSALPGGYKLSHSNYYEEKNESAYFYTSSPDWDEWRFISLSSGSSSVYTNTTSLAAFSVRCIKDQ